MSLVRFRSEAPRFSDVLFVKRTYFAAVAHLVERHLAKVEVASSSLVSRSIFLVLWPSGKAKVCKTFIHQFKSGQHLQEIPVAVAAGIFCCLQKEVWSAGAFNRLAAML